jgi:hypothetical protein
MSKELAEIRYYIGDTTLDEDLNDEDIPKDEIIVENTIEHDIHLRIIDCLLELKNFLKTGSYDILENFTYSQLYDFLTE